jgi:hypothetical protein
VAVAVAVMVELVVREVRMAEEIRTFDSTMSAVGDCWTDVMTPA